MNRVDIARFEFDFDTTWSAFFTDSKLRIYSRYGGRDEHEPEARLSKSSLLQTMREVLAAHRGPANTETQPRAPQAPREIPRWQPEPAKGFTPLDIPLLRRGHQGCVHCHQIREYSLLQAYHDGVFRRELLFPYPLPESIGIDVDRAHGHRVAVVREPSPATGHLRPGDVLVQCEDVPIRSEFDLRWALHRLPETTSHIRLIVERPASADAANSEDAKTLLEVKLSLPRDWRQSELRWRKSSRSVPADWGFRAAALAKFERRDLGLPETGMAIRVLSIRSRGLVTSLGLQKGDIIVALAGDSKERSLEQLRSDILRQAGPGDSVQLTVRRDGELLELRGAFPPWHTDETTVP
jgi:hypothetical protein